MLSTTLPTSALASAGYWLALKQAPVQVPGWVVKLQIYLFFPRLLRSINAELTNEKLAGMSAEDAGRIEKELKPLVLLLGQMLDAKIQVGIIERLVLRPWRSDVAREYERLRDVLEALQWAVDPELRSYLENSLKQVEAKIG